MYNVSPLPKPNLVYLLKQIDIVKIQHYEIWNSNTYIALNVINLVINYPFRTTSDYYYRFH
jgi:uncharacterized Fe-S radical SAM superfamily protein PflX